MFFDEIAKIEAHESEVLCVEFTPSESGNDMKKSQPILSVSLSNFVRVRS